MRRLGIWGKHVDQSRIDEAVSNRDPDLLANLICTEGVDEKVRLYLAEVIFDILVGKKKFPRRRPKKHMLQWYREQIGQRVWETKKSKGLNKIGSAVHEVAKEKNLSPRTIWTCWKAFDPGKYEWRREEAEHDYLMEMANEAAEAAREAAITHLKEEHGDREFTEEEVSDEIEEQQRAWANFDDY
jgi:hypothetical protein